MNGIGDWFQNNWIDLARLLVQCAILAAIVHHGRQALATLRASQEQVGALLKLSVSEVVAERSAAAVEPATQFEAGPVDSRQAEPARETERAKQFQSAPVSTRQAEPELEPVFAGFAQSGYAAEREQSLGGRVAGSAAAAFTTPSQRETTAPQWAASSAPQRAESPAFTPWVSAPVSGPIGEPLRLSQEAAPGPAVRPNVSTWLQAPMRSNGANPWRKMVRWLQAPVRG